MRIYEIAGAAFLAGGLVAAGLTILPSDPYRDCRTERIAGLDELGGPFALMTETGALITDAKLFERPALVYFGYTFCPDICPLDNGRNAVAVDILAEQGVDVQPVFVSLDPKRDTLERLADYTDAFHDDLLGLTGRPDQIAGAAKAYGVLYDVPETDDEFYLVDHSTHTYIVMPGNRVVDIIRREDGPEDAARKVGCYLSNSA